MCLETIAEKNWLTELICLFLIVDNSSWEHTSAPSKLPKCRYFRVPLRLARSKSAKCRFLSCSPPDLRPRSYQSVIIYHFVPTCDLEVTKVSLPSCSPPVLRPRSYQSITIHFVHPARTLEVTKVFS